MIKINIKNIKLIKINDVSFNVKIFHFENNFECDFNVFNNVNKHLQDFWLFWIKWWWFILKNVKKQKIYFDCVFLSILLNFIFVEIFFL